MRTDDLDLGSSVDGFIDQSPVLHCQVFNITLEADPKQNQKKQVILTLPHDSLRWLRITEGTPMAWTKTTRKQYRRDGLRYASDTTAMEWILLSELLPQRSRTGRPPKWHFRTIM